MVAAHTETVLDSLGARPVTLKCSMLFGSHTIHFRTFLLNSHEKRYTVGMNDKEVIAILLQMAEKYPLEEKETEAIHEAIGILSWSSLMDGRIQSIKKRRERRFGDD